MSKFTLTSSPGETLKTWALLLRNLTFGENFKGYEWSGTIEAGEEKKITHPLKVIPTRFLVVESKESCTLIKDANNASTVNFFFIKNMASTTSFTGKVLILP